MGGEVAKQDYDHPTNDPVTIPNPTDEAGTGLVFQGFERRRRPDDGHCLCRRRRGSPGSESDHTGDSKLRRLRDVCARRVLSAAWSGEARAARATAHTIPSTP